MVSGAGEPLGLGDGAGGVTDPYFEHPADATMNDANAQASRQTMPRREFIELALLLGMGDAEVEAQKWRVSWCQRRTSRKTTGGSALRADRPAGVEPR